MFNSYILERNRQKENEKQRYTLDLRKTQKRNYLANRYRGRVLDFMNKMAKKTKFVNESAHELSRSVYTSVNIRKRRSSQVSKSVDYNDFITEPGDSNAFNLRPREKTKEIAGDFNKNFSGKNSLQRVYDIARENSMKANFENFLEKDSSKIKSGREILPELHDKTHFKGASTLLTYDNEINDIKSNAMLISKFESVKKSISGSPFYKANSRSIDQRRDKLSCYNSHNNDSNHNNKSKVNLIVKVAGRNLKDENFGNTKSQPKGLNLNISQSNISDYGFQCGGITSPNTLKRKKPTLPRANFHQKAIKKFSSEIFNRNKQQSRASISRKLQDSTIGDHDDSVSLDIPLITKQVLSQCGIVKCMP
ncbi:unnamed protein product [Moneuplotes crassus]|uniref:Uncharacterized protein n=1 Tax=Euplotes crassus TaxID=5936 RepID=A0AAD1XEL7_EUPCR|nr:unnamed protein product [Moneuplotes crassus]